jgi:ribose transport system ATP-binding protein
MRVRNAGVRPAGSQASSPALRLEAITKHFAATIALDGVDFTIAPGEVHALIGENGAGKSTLMNVLSGAIAPDSGVMFVDGEPYAPRGPADARAVGIAHIHQELALCAHLSVAVNIAMGIEPNRGGLLRREEMSERAATLLAEFGRSEIDPSTRVASLSLADRQVVEICRALARDARILLMDEPTSSLQRADVERLFETVRRLRDRGIAIIYISHFLEEVREIASQFTVLRDGRSVGSGELTEVRDEELISMMVGAQTRVSVLHQPAPEPQGAAQPEALLEVENLSAPPRLRVASFVLHRGQILGIAGLVGSGRSDLIRTLFGLQRATGGVVRLRGQELKSLARIRHGFGYLSEDRKGEGLALQLPIADNVTMSRFGTCSRAGWIDRDQQNAQTDDVITRLRIKTPGPRGIVGKLSGGNQQKVALARLLHQDPDILLLDEPARGIDIGSKADIYREIARLASEGKGIVMVSSYLPELLAVCDTIAVMTRGRLSPARSASEWTADSILQAAIG